MTHSLLNLHTSLTCISTLRRKIEGCNLLSSELIGWPKCPSSHGGKFSCNPSRGIAAPLHRRIHVGLHSQARQRAGQHLGITYDDPTEGPGGEEPVNHLTDLAPRNVREPARESACVVDG